MWVFKTIGADEGDVERGRGPLTNVAPFIDMPNRTNLAWRCQGAVKMLELAADNLAAFVKALPDRTPPRHFTTPPYLVKRSTCLADRELHDDVARYLIMEDSEGGTR